VNGSSDWNQNESSEKTERIVARNVAILTDEFGHEGPPRGDVEMKKSLMATVAAVALIAGASMASAAEGAKEQPGVKAGAAVKAEPEMKRGADIKAGAETKGKAETTGAGVESKSETKAEMKSEPKAEMKAEPKAEGKADNKANADKAKPSTTGQAAPAAKSSASEQTAPAAKSATDEKAAPAAKPSAQSTTTTPNAQAGASTTSSPTGAAVSLSPEQKTQIRTSVLQSSSAPKVSRSSINFNVSVGTVVPRSVHFVTVPETLVRIHPAWRGYSYFIVDEEIIIVDSRTLQIVAILTV
jgi:hypothetical protein